MAVSFGEGAPTFSINYQSLSFYCVHNCFEGLMKKLKKRIMRKNAINS